MTYPCAHPSNDLNWEGFKRFFSYKHLCRKKRASVKETKVKVTSVFSFAICGASKHWDRESFDKERFIPRISCAGLFARTSKIWHCLEGPETLSRSLNILSHPLPGFVFIFCGLPLMRSSEGSSYGNRDPPVLIFFSLLQSTGLLLAPQTCQAYRPSHSHHAGVPSAKMLFPHLPAGPAPHFLQGFIQKLFSPQGFPCSTCVTTPTPFAPDLVFLLSISQYLIRYF